MALIKRELGDEAATLLAGALERREHASAAVPDAPDTTRDEGSTLQ